MELLPNNILRKFRETGSQEKVNDPMVIVKYFYPFGGWTWYATEFNEEDRLFFGYVIGQDNEWGYFSLDELKSFRGDLGLTIERDLYFESKPISNYVNEMTSIYC